MTGTPPQLLRCLSFITQRLAKASRDAEMRPSKVHQQRVVSLEMLAAACVSEAARIAVRDRRAPARPRLDPEEGTEPRGVWTPPAG
jgi:hypothetical protein